MAFAKSVWDQLRNRTSGDLIRALLADGWEEDVTKGATRAFRKGHGQRVVIHFHPKKTHGPNLLKGLIEDIGWSVDDLRKLKLIKK